MDSSWRSKDVTLRVKRGTEVSSVDVWVDTISDL